MRSSTEQVQEARTAPSDSDRVSDRWWTVALLSTIFLSFVVRVIALGDRSVFADELASLQFAQMSWHTFWQLVARSEANMSLYYVLLRLWIHLGNSVPFLRFLSVLPAVATVPLIYALGKDLFSKTAGLFASLLFALNTFHLSYSQAARGYSLAVFLATLSCWFFIRSIRAPSRRNLIAYVLASAAALYGHFFAGFVLLAQCVSLISWHPPRPLIVRQALWMLAVGVLAIPLFIFVAVHKTDPISWAEPVTGKDIYHFFTYLSGSGLKFALSIIALALAAKEYLRAGHVDPRERTERPFMFLLMWLLVPLLTTLLISIWKPVFSPRFLMICLPAFVLLVGRGLSTIRPAYAQYAVTGILLLSWVTALPAYYRQPGIEDWKSATMYMHRHLQAADTIIVNNPAYRPILEYSFPEFGLVLPTPHVASGPARRISPLESTHIWLLLCHAAPSEIEDVASLKRHFVLLADEHFIGIEVIEFVRQTPAKTP